MDIRVSAKIDLGSRQIIIIVTVVNIGKHFLPYCREPEIAEELTGSTVNPGRNVKTLKNLTSSKQKAGRSEIVVSRSC